MGEAGSARSIVKSRGRQNAALAQISVIKHPLKDLNFSSFGFDIGNFEIRLLDLKE
jgi:hypothetical protein